MLTTNNARFQFLRKALVLPVTFAAVIALSVSATETRATPAISTVVKNDTLPAPVTIREQHNAKGKKKLPDNLLYIVNGNVSSAEEVKKLEPDQIKSINVWKDKAATDKYGAAGANGVIEITLK